MMAQLLIQLSPKTVAGIVTKPPRRHHTLVRKLVQVAPEVERRSRTRYPIRLDVRFQGGRSSRRFAGFGRTLNISSAGILIASEQAVFAGAPLEICIRWPWLLDGDTPIQLVAEAKVVRSHESGFAAVLLRHQFRTAKALVGQPAFKPRAMAAIVPGKL
jgi:hypothetical protein